ncbi:MAG: glycosyltransferase [Peptoanaerobacter stomatis]
MTYTDGSVEDFIIDYLKNNDEKDILNKENDGAIFHNFTESRENLLNWYPFNKQGSVLEIGAGMGALTKLLSEKCDRVVAVEMSQKRAEIIKLRCRDKKNVEIFTQDIKSLTLDEKFDYVLLIGVLEYAQVINKTKDSFVELLEKAKSFLRNDDSRLIIAIENKFGLKYWCGASEDHTGIPFDSINGYKDNNLVSTYKSNGVKTFSKVELENMLVHVGLKGIKYYYPLPDYKFPMTIFTDEGLPTYKDIQGIKFTYPMESELIAQESKLYEELLINNVFPFFSNSFLLETSINENADFNNIKKIYHKRDYDEKFRQITLLENDNVIKLPASYISKKHLDYSFENLKELSDKGISVIDFNKNENSYKVKFLPLKEASITFKQYLKEGNLIKALTMVDLLKENIIKSSCFTSELSDIHKKLDLNIDVNLGHVLKYGYVDMTFQNSFYTKDNTLIFFDQEWKIENIPLKYILYRAINYAYDQNNSKFKINIFFEYCDISKEEESLYNIYENLFLKSLMDSLNCSIFDKKMFNESLTLKYKRDSKTSSLNTHINQLIQLEREQKEKLRESEIEIEQIISDNKHIIEKIKVQNQSEIEKIKIQNQSEIEKIKIQNQSEIEKVIRENENKIKGINDKNSLLINKLETELNNKNGHIELLLKSDRELSNIKRRWRWKIVNFPFYVTKKIAKILLPKGTKGYFFAKLFMNSIRNPRLYLSKLNFKNTKKLRKMMSNDGVQRTIEKLEQFNEFNTKINEYEKIEVLDIQNINYDEIIVPCFSNITVSIIIPVYNQFEYTYNCVKSIVENTIEISYEIIIVDDVSSDKTLDINNVIKNIIVIRNERNLGFLLNCNNASKKARGKYLYFLNNDTNIQKNAIEKLITIFDDFENVGLVGSKLVYPDGRLQEAGGIFWNDASAWNYGNRANAEMSEYNYVKEVDYVSGASMMILKDIWEKIGGFDERYIPAYCEDSDFAFEVRKKGYKVMYQPKSIVVHFEGVSNGTDTNIGIKAYQVENQKKFFTKWRNILEKEHYENGKNVFKARDRSFNKKTILVIDHYVPHYDKDAGSRTIYQYLKLFVKMGLNVKFIGDNYFRHEPYTSELQELGIEVLYGVYYANNWKEWIKVNSKYLDYVFFNRPHITEKYINFVKENTNARIFYYGHDLHFLREKREYELTQNEELFNSYQKTMRDEFSIMRKSDFVYYPSFVEVEEIKKYDSSINVKAIQAYMYDGIEYKQYNIKNRKNLLFVGGFGHKPNVDAILWFVKEVFPNIIKNDPKIKLNIVGSNPTQDIKDLNSENINVVGYVSDEELEKFYLETRIVVVPLRYGAGIKGKVIEAMTKGVPIVTTSVGVEGLENIENMFSICDNADDFANYIIKHYSNEEILRNTSDKYYDYIIKYFSSEHALNIIKDDF